MKQKLLTIKSLLVAVLLGVGVNGAWADSQTASLTESVLATLYPNNEIANYFDFVAMAKSWNDASEENKATYAVTGGSNTYKVNKIQLIQVSNPTSMNIFSVQAVGTSNAFSWRWDTSKTKYGLWNWGNARYFAFEVTKGQIVVMEGGYTATATGSCDATYVQNNGYNTFTATEDGKIAFSSAGANVRALAILNPSSSAVNYTVKYVDEEGTEIKDATEGSGEAGASITVTTAEKASFKNAGETKKYIYKSDDSEGKTIASNGSTIVTITFREADTWSYTVNAMNGETKIEELATGSAFELDAVKVPFHKYYNIDGTLYQKGANSNEYKETVTLDEDDKVAGLAYTASDKTNVVFFKEAEDIATLTTTSEGGTSTRCSFAQGGYAEDDALITTLTPGKYILTGAGYGGNLVFKAGANEVLNMETVGYWRETAGAEFTITENTNITFKGGASGGGASLDYVIIQQTGVAAPISSYGKSTFSSTYPVDCANLPDGLKAYKATAATASTVTMEEVTTAVAGMTGSNKTGLVLVGTPSTTYFIPIAASGTEPSGNLLFGCDGSWNEVTAAVSGTNFVLSVQSENVVWAPVKSTNAPISAGQAALWADVEIADARSLNMVFGDEDVTGINEAKSQKPMANGQYFDLQGRRVAQPAKGLYIVNGKKVVIK